MGDEPQAPGAPPAGFGRDAPPKLPTLTLGLLNLPDLVAWPPPLSMFTLIFIHPSVLAAASGRLSFGAGSREGRQSNRLGRTLSDLSSPLPPTPLPPHPRVCWPSEPIPFSGRRLLSLRGCWGWGCPQPLNTRTSTQNREAARGPSAARRPECVARKTSPDPQPPPPCRPSKGRPSRQPSRLPRSGRGPPSAPRPPLFNLHHNMLNLR